MRRSIRWPPQLAGGRVQMTTDPETATDNLSLRQVIAIMLQPGDSTNPWNDVDDLGVDDATFERTSRARLAHTEAQARRQFARLERESRARLIGLGVEASGADVLILVHYEDLETGARQQLEVRIDG